MDEHPILPVLRGASLVAALLATALQAGLYYAFAVSVMPGLRQAGGRTFIDAMQQINVAILNPWFFLTFLGAPLLTVAAALLHLSGTARAVLPWIAAAAVLCVVGVLVTGAVNVPLNEALAAAGPPDRIADPARALARFEASWARWNVVRALLFASALGCLAWALVIYGRVRATA
jgi:uncharacterized membrane protein